MRNIDDGFVKVNGESLHYINGSQNNLQYSADSLFLYLGAVSSVAQGVGYITEKMFSENIAPFFSGVATRIARDIEGITNSIYRFITPATVAVEYTRMDEEERSSLIGRVSTLLSASYSAAKGVELLDYCDVANLSKEVVEKAALVAFNAFFLTELVTVGTTVESIIETRERLNAERKRLIENMGDPGAYEKLLEEIAQDEHALKNNYLTVAKSSANAALMILTGYFQVTSAAVTVPLSLVVGSSKVGKLALYCIKPIKTELPSLVGAEVEMQDMSSRS